MYILRKKLFLVMTAIFDGCYWKPYVFQILDFNFTY
jgi:hypothetical protein